MIEVSAAPRSMIALAAANERGILPLGGNADAMQPPTPATKKAIATDAARCVNPVNATVAADRGCDRSSANAIA